MELPDIDSTCRDILQYLVARWVGGREPVRFNELLRNLDKSGFKISRPTLSTHLRHLTEKKLVKRTQADKQNVNYRFYEEEWGEIGKYFEREREIREFFEDEKESFDSDTPLDQLGHVYSIITLRVLMQLKHELLSISEPEKKFEHTLYIMSYSSLWDHFIKWFVSNYIHGDEKYRNEIIELLEALSHNIKSEIFTHRLRA